MLSGEQITKFQIIYKNRFGKEITKEEALEKGIKLLRLLELTYKPMTKKEYKLVENRSLEKLPKNLI
mgnify:CR=1 FL=1